MRRCQSAGLPRIKSFSLVELLVSIAILSIFVILLMGMLSSLTGAWQAGQAHNERRTVAQAVLDRMSRDICQAALPLSRTSTSTLALVINPNWLGTTQYPQSIFFQAPVATDGGIKGNLAVVGYFVQWVAATNGAPLTPCLSRVLINPSSPDYAIYSGSPNAWITGPLLAQYAPATSASGYMGLMAENVLGLWVQALDPMGVPIATQTGLPTGETFDSRYPYTFANKNLLAGNGYTATNVASALPASIQIAIAVIDSRTAKHLTGNEKPNAPTFPPTSTSFWNDIQTFYNGLPTIIKKGAEIQTTTVPLAEGPR